MLFNYRYVNHSIEGFQVYLDHLVKEVWCKATGDFSLDLLHPVLKLIVEEIFNDDAITKDHLDGPIRRIYELFRTHLTAAQRQQVSDWYDHNNDIEALCACDPLKLPATYADIRAINADLETALKEFCKNLWPDVLNLGSVKKRIGSIAGHYHAFVTENKAGKCPYCGYGDIESVHNTTRSDYDHYLPKGTYPFNAVNFHNLAPMCDRCNSAYKLQKDPTRHIDPISRKVGGVRRKAFYSYADAFSGISITVVLKTKDVTNLLPKDIELQLNAPGRTEEVEGWNEVFGIEERYKAKCCGDNDGKGWLTRVEDECQNYNLTPQKMLEAEIRSAESKPWTDSNFLKRPFLLACQIAEVICKK